MEVSLKIFLFAYLIFLFFWVIFSFFNIFHAVKFGLANKTNIIVMIIYIVVSLIIIGVSFMFISTIDWNEKIDILSLFI